MGRWLSHSPGLELSPSEGMEVLCGSGRSFSHGSACLEVDAAALLTKGWQPASGAGAKAHQLLSQPMSEVNMERSRLKMEASFPSWALLLLWNGRLLEACLRGGRDSHLRAPTARTFLFCSETAFSQLSQITHSIRFDAVLFLSCSQASSASRRWNRNLMDQATLLKREGRRHCSLWGPVLAAGSRTRQIPLEKLLTKSQMQNK